MSELWNFSPSLQEQVKLCVASASKDKDNKWFKEFRHILPPVKATERIPTHTLIDLCDSLDIERNKLQEAIAEPCKEIEDHKIAVSEDLDTINIEEIVESMDTDIRSNIDFIIAECMKNQTLLPLLANRLSLHTIEKLCSAIFDKKDLKTVFLCPFFQFFLPTYIKREYNSNTLDIIIRSSKKYPIEFQELLKMIIKDVEIPNKVLQDYVLSLNEKDHLKFIIDITEFDLTGAEFVNHLFAIYTAYKDCTKTKMTQSYVESLLFHYSSSCVTDRNYGRLFLAYLQAQKAVKCSTSYEKLQKLLEEHVSPFKRPCLSLIAELMRPDKGNDSFSDSSE